MDMEKQQVDINSLMALAKQVSVYLSGNGPLVEVLREALIRSAKEKKQFNKKTETGINALIQGSYSLLEAMAESLGYKDKITWKTIQKPYKPKGMADAEQNQQFFQQGQLAAAQMAINMVQKATSAMASDTIQEIPKNN